MITFYPVSSPNENEWTVAINKNQLGSDMRWTAFSEGYNIHCSKVVEQFSVPSTNENEVEWEGGTEFIWIIMLFRKSGIGRKNYPL